MNSESTPIHDPDFECSVIAALNAGPPVVLVYVRALENRVAELFGQREAALARVAELETQRDEALGALRLAALPTAVRDRIRADERARIAAAIERDHQPGTYPHEMAKAIRANATPDGHPL